VQPPVRSFCCGVVLQVKTIRLGTDIRASKLFLKLLKTPHGTGVARFFLAQYTKSGKDWSKWPQSIPKTGELYQTATKYSYGNIFRSKAIQNIITYIKL
jgi:hypothetical protein